MTYRVGHHSTSDDSTRYRSVEEIKEARKSDPIARCRAFLERSGFWDAASEEELRTSERRAVLLALEAAEQKQKPSSDELFTDVYATKPQHLKDQEAHFKAHMAKYPEAKGGR
jgi:2-oxoisovalerate dehydrogenase E1 component alpha subunit